MMKRFLQLRAILGDLPVNGGVIHGVPMFAPEFFDVARAQQPPVRMLSCGTWVGMVRSGEGRGKGLLDQHSDSIDERLRLHIPGSDLVDTKVD